MRGLPPLSRARHHPKTTPSVSSSPIGLMKRHYTQHPPGSSPRHWQITRSSPTIARRSTLTTPPVPPRWRLQGRERTTRRPTKAPKGKFRAKPATGSRPSSPHGPRSSKAGRPSRKRPCRRRSRHWKTDADLAGIRDEKALATLPENERRCIQAALEGGRSASD